MTSVWVDRKDEFADLLLKGQTQTEIAQRFSVSSQRVGQMIRKHGLQDQAEAGRVLRQQREAVLREHKRIAKVHARWENVHAVAQSLAVTENRRYSPDDLLNAVRQASWSAGGKGISKRAYAKAAVHRPDWPSVSLLVIRFGSWENVCAEAGIPMSSNENVPKERKYTPESMLEAVHAFMVTVDPATQMGSNLEYSKRRAEEQDWPSLGLIAHRFGSWSAIRRTVWVERMGRFGIGSLVEQADRVGLVASLDPLTVRWQDGQIEPYTRPEA